MYTKRYLTVMLAAMMLLASCGQSASGSAGTTASGGTDTTAAEDTTSYLDEIPRHDLGGSEFRIGRGPRPCLLPLQRNRGRGSPFRLLIGSVPFHPGWGEISK